MFGESSLHYVPGQNNYSVQFGSGTINLQDLRPSEPLVLSVECTFGELKVILSREVEIQLSGSSTFGSLSGPDLQSTSFGNYFYTSPGFNPSQPGISLQARVSFGELKIYYL